MGLGRGMALDIAVVDDDPAFRDSLATLFEREGCSVRTYEGGDAFLDAVEQGIQCDCLILEFHMPVRSGLDVLQAIGGTRYPTPVLMISGRADIPTAVAAIKAGAYDFIEKPLEAEAMIERVQDAVRTYNDRRTRSV